MDRNELLNYLDQKRMETAGVAQAQQTLSDDKNRLENAKRKWRKTIIFLWILVGISFFGYNPSDPNSLGGILFGAILPAGLMIFKYFKYIKPLNEQITKDQAKLNEELNNLVYQNGKNGFPEKFYNYGDVYLLWKLVSENRATTLQEAFNLLETQQYRANQMAIQEQIKAIQEDTARSAKIAAVASTVSAVNSARPRKVEVSGTINHHVN
ncbi:hypothetical protein K7D69_03265 [Lactobacillus johnsonii]|uniref:hypothetical protein n=1 Tax=Lactobacillus johnsonii TaxID=33959 RepID=UPI001CBB35BF|nr:hypothetical protein [Lactobacillus johnsonii]MBZ4028290.1 hypothetical protein [Lactobacillus johnsonii]